MNLSEFLLARIAEDEAVARAATPSGAAEHPGMGWNAAASAEPQSFAAIYGGPIEAGYRTEDIFRFSDEMDCEECVRPSGADLQQMARFGDPTRVLAECEAKRRIVAMMRLSYVENDVEWWALHDALQFLAIPYADHPDFREEWRA